jgi:hypothetical protein
MKARSTRMHTFTNVHADALRPVNDRRTSIGMPFRVLVAL